MRKANFILAAAMLMVSAAVMAQQSSKVYLTREISPESLVKIYKALGVEAKGRVAVKMSTGEGSNPNYLKPELVKNLIWEVDGTIVECNTAYGNGPADKKDERNTSENHWKVIERHGFTKYFPVDIMDEYDEIRIPVKDQTHIKYDIVGGHRTARLTSTRPARWRNWIWASCGLQSSSVIRMDSSKVWQPLPKP